MSRVEPLHVMSAVHVFKVPQASAVVRRRGRCASELVFDVLGQKSSEGRLMPDMRSTRKSDAMTPADVEATVCRVLNEFYPDVVGLSDRTCFVALGADADEMLDLVCELEEAFNMVIEGDTISWPTVGALISDMQARVAALGAAQEPQR